MVSNSVPAAVRPTTVNSAIAEPLLIPNSEKKITTVLPFVLAFWTQESGEGKDYMAHIGAGVSHVREGEPSAAIFEDYGHSWN